jgi:hypothetical protein
MQGLRKVMFLVALVSALPACQRGDVPPPDRKPPDRAPPYQPHTPGVHLMGLPILQAVAE